MDEFYGRWADLNGDGEIDNFEKIVEMEEMERMDKYISGDDDEDDEEEKMESDLEMAGLDYNELSWMGGESTNNNDGDEVLDFKTSGDIPNMGEAHKIYKAESEAKLYQWNSDKLKYEPLNVVDVEVDITDIDYISGGDATDLI